MNIISWKVYLLSSPKHKHDVMLMMQLSSCLQKKTRKNYGLSLQI